MASGTGRFCFYRLTTKLRTTGPGRRTPLRSASRSCTGPIAPGVICWYVVVFGRVLLGGWL